MPGVLVAVLSLPAVAAAARAVRFDGSPGTNAPPTRLDGVKMSRFGREHRRRGTFVRTVNGPSGQVRFSRMALLVQVKDVKRKGPYWRTWSNHYHGPAYFAAGSITLSLPPHTKAFYFYVEPDDRGTYDVTATASGATSGPLPVSSDGGARFFGFVAERGARLSSIEVSSNDRHTSKRHFGGFAIGEFGIHEG